MAEVACIGECMIELREMADGRLARGYGGDTLNTAIYLARLGISVEFVTALGDDVWSDEMVAGWQAEGVGTARVARLPGRLPGLYIVQTDAGGERRFFYWRDASPARALFDLPGAEDLAEALAACRILYVSGVTLSLYGEAGRARLLTALDHARGRGARIAFDTNFRPRNWPDRAAAQAAFRQVLDRATLILASAEDLELLFGAEGEREVLARRASAEIVLKLAHPACRVILDGRDEVVPAEEVAEIVDTTAAGDSFAAAYLAARLAGLDAGEAARAGHQLAGTVIRHPGAIIPRSAMPAGLHFPTRPAMGAPRP